MRSFTFTLATLSLLSSVFAAPSGLSPVRTFSGERNHGSYIVKYKDGAKWKAEVNALGIGENVTHGQWDSSFFNGFAGESSQFECFERTVDGLRA